MQLAHVFRARIVDVNSESLVIETTGAEDKIDGLVEILRGFRNSRDGAEPAASP